MATLKVQGPLLLLLLRIRAANDGQQDGQGPVQTCLTLILPPAIFGMPLLRQCSRLRHEL